MNIKEEFKNGDIVFIKVFDTIRCGLICDKKLFLNNDVTLGVDDLVEMNIVARWRGDTNLFTARLMISDWNLKFTRSYYNTLDIKWYNLDIFNSLKEY